jgi:hypothetical protein
LEPLGNIGCSNGWSGVGHAREHRFVRRLGNGWLGKLGQPVTCERGEDGIGEL